MTLRFDPVLADGIAQVSYFLKAIQDNAPPVPTHYPKMKKLNVRGPEVLGHTPHVRALSVSELESAVQSPAAVLLDTRDMLAFGGGHIEGALNIGLRPILSVWAGWLIDTDAPIYLVLAEDDKDLVDVVTLLWRTGHTNIKGYLAGGMRSWQESGKVLKHLPQLSVHELEESLDEYLPLDVRKDEEWLGGHIPGVSHHFLGKFPDSIPSLDKDRKMATYCASGYRASIAASWLQKHGFEHVSNVPGSFLAWQEADKPTET